MPHPQPHSNITWFSISTAELPPPGPAWTSHLPNSAWNVNSDNSIRFCVSFLQDSSQVEWCQAGSGRWALGRCGFLPSPSAQNGNSGDFQDLCDPPGCPLSQKVLLLTSSHIAFPFPDQEKPLFGLTLWSMFYPRYQPPPPLLNQSHQISAALALHGEINDSEDNSHFFTQTPWVFWFFQHTGRLHLCCSLCRDLSQGSPSGFTPS